MIQVGKKYELDGNVYRCEEIKESGLGWFQALNEGGTNKESFNNGSQVIHGGRHIIFKRINELKEIV